MGTIFRYALVIGLLAFLALGPRAYSQEHFPGDPPPKPPPTGPTKKPPAPKPKPPPPKIPSHATLLVVTNPSAAKVTIRDPSSGKPVKQGTSKDSNYRAELASNKTYDIEVSADGYVAVTRKGVLLKLSDNDPVRVDLVPTTGSIEIALGMVGPDSNLMIKLDGQEVTGFKVSKELNMVMINDVPAGRHKLQVSAPGFLDYGQELEVTGGSSRPISPTFQRAIGKVTVVTEPGANVYLDGKYKGVVPATGMMPFEESTGSHTIRVEKDGFDPSPDEPLTFATGESTHNVELKRVKSSAEFSDYFTSSGDEYWTHPPGWQFKRGGVTVKGDGVGLLKDKTWLNFKMILEIELSNEKGASWIVRARNEKTYFLFELSGPKGESGTYFTTYLCENGQPQKLKGPELVTQDLHTKITNKNKKINIEVEVDVSGSTIATSLDGNKISLFEEATKLSYGTVGFRAMKDQEFLVNRVTVIPSK